MGHFAIGGVSDDGTEAVGVIIERTGRLDYAYGASPSYRLRILLDAKAVIEYPA